MMNILGCFIALFFVVMLGMSVVAHIAHYRSIGSSPFRGKAGCLGLLLFSGLAFSLMGAVSTVIEFLPKYRRVSPGDVYGTYRIDRNFYPGQNADWQYEHYRFKITSENKFVLTEIDDNGVAHQYQGKVTWKDTKTRRALWSAKLSKPHHLQINAPTLYRSYFYFYYVIPSKRYGNMFFRRESDYPIYEFGFSVVAIPTVWVLRYRKYRNTPLKQNF